MPKKKGKSATSRTLEYLKKQGWEAAIVERFLSFAGPHGMRKDMFGFGDIVCMGNGRIMAVQSCGQAFSEHHLKITEDEYVTPLVYQWLECNGLLVLVGWRQLVVKFKNGNKGKRWKPRVRQYYINLAGEIAWTDLEDESILTGI
jgi:hypothetical protein